MVLTSTYEFRVGSHRELHSDLFETPFDADHPATTPSGLKTIDVNDVDNDPVLLALAKAAARLTNLGIDLDARLEDVQYVIKAEGQDPIAITGANSFEGVFNMAQSGASRSTAMFANVPIGDALPNTLLRALDENDDRTTLSRNFSAIKPSCTANHSGVMWYLMPPPSKPTALNRY